MRKLPLDDVFLLVLAILAVLPSFIPIILADGLPVTTMYYPQGATPVYIDLFERMKMGYIPLLFSAITMMLIAIGDIIGARIPSDAKLLVSVAFSVSIVAFLHLLPATGTFKLGEAVGSATVLLILTIKPTPLYYLYNIAGFSVLFTISFIPVAYYIFDLLLKRKAMIESLKLHLREEYRKNDKV